MNLSKLGSFTLLAVASLTIMVGCVIVPGLTTIAPALGVGDAASWLVTLPSLGVVVLGPLAGRAIDRFGSHRTLCLGLAAYGVLGFGGIYLRGPSAVFADRLLLGGATAMIMAAGTGLISAFYTGQARLAMIALQGMSIEIGGVIFLFIGGALTVLGWQWPYALYLMSWLLLLMVLMFVPRNAGAPNRSTDGPRESLTKNLKVVLCAAAFSMILFFTGVIVLPGKLHQSGLSEPEVGYYLAFVSLVAVCGAALMPRLNGLLSGFGTLSFGFVCFAFAHLVFALAGALPIFVLGGVALGLGFGFTIPLANHLVVDMSRLQDRGRNLAYLSMAVFLGQFLSSFMEFVPGSVSLMFGFASLIGLLVSLALARFHLSLGKVQGALNG